MGAAGGVGRVVQLEYVLVLGGEEAEGDGGLHDAGARLDVPLGFLLRKVLQDLPVRHDDDGSLVAELDVEAFALVESAVLGVGQGAQGWVVEVGLGYFVAVLYA